MLNIPASPGTDTIIDEVFKEIDEVNLSINFNFDPFKPTIF